MGLFARLFGTRLDEHAAVRPLWQSIIAEARDPAWYAPAGIADTMAGRFDAVSMVLGLVLLRLEREPDAGLAVARLTELFVADIDGQLRQGGVGDVVMGKRMGKLISALGGRIDAFRAGLAATDDQPLIDAVTRNMTLADEADPASVAERMRALAARLAARDQADLLAGRIAA